MVIHFTIAIIYLATLAGCVGLIRRTDGFYPKVFLFLLVLGIVATITAGVAGVISESYVHVSNGVGKMLENHKRDGEITGILMVIAFAIQGYVHRKERRISILSFLFCVAATVMVSVTGYIGGSMVYDHGLGVHAAQSFDGANHH